MIVAASVSIIESFLLIVLEHITSKRDYIPGVTAIYFVEPSDRNVALIINVFTLLTLIWNQDFKEIKSFIGAESCIDRYTFFSWIMHSIIYCGMEDKSGESGLYDRVALRFKGGSI